MRKIIALLLLASSFIWAQSGAVESRNKTGMNRHNISVGYGFGTVFDFGAALASSFEDDSYGQVSVGYGYKVGSLFETGALLNYELASEAQIFTLMAVAKFNWINKEYFRLYSNLDLGVSMGLNSDDELEWMPMGQVSLAGVEFCKDIVFFLETLGWGQSGLFYTGLKYAF